MHSKNEIVQSSAEALRYPWENHPGHDQVVEVMPGVLWVRLKLPFRLNHVNIYPDEAIQKKLFVINARDPATQRIINRLWTRVKTGK